MAAKFFSLSLCFVSPTYDCVEKTWTPDQKQTPAFIVCLILFHRLLLYFSLILMCHILLFIWGCIFHNLKPAKEQMIFVKSWYLKPSNEKSVQFLFAITVNVFSFIPTFQASLEQKHSFIQVSLRSGSNPIHNFTDLPHFHCYHRISFREKSIKSNCELPAEQQTKVIRIWRLLMSHTVLCQSTLWMPLLFFCVIWNFIDFYWHV